MMTSLFPAITNVGTKYDYVPQSTLQHPHQIPPRAFVIQLSFLKCEYPFYLNGTAILHLQDLRQRVRDQRYLRRASGLAAPDIAYSINFVHLPVSIHTDASADKKVKQVASYARLI